MPHGILALAIAALLIAGTGAPSRAERLFELGDDGRTFLYTARPGDIPGRVAEMFGVTTEQLLAANKITDATRIDTGFVYRIPNAAAEKLAGEVQTLREDRDRRAREATDAVARATAAVSDAKAARADAAAAEARTARLVRLERFWPWVQAVLVVLLSIAVATSVIARAATRRQRQAERYARTLATELEDRKRANMADRQESAKRILDLEHRVRTLEAQLGPRSVASSRTS